LIIYLDGSGAIGVFLQQGSIMTIQFSRFRGCSSLNAPGSGAIGIYINSLSEMNFEHFGRDVTFSTNFGGFCKFIKFINFINNFINYFVFYLGSNAVDVRFTSSTTFAQSSVCFSPIYDFNNLEWVFFLSYFLSFFLILIFS
jgi:hypothetical protein